MTDEQLGTEIQAIVEHLINVYEANEAIAISINVMANLIINVETEDKQHLIKNLYELLDAIKYDELDIINTIIH